MPIPDILFGMGIFGESGDGESRDGSFGLICEGRDGLRVYQNQYECSASALLCCTVPIA